MIDPHSNSHKIHGILLIDKQQGVSSNTVLQKVKRLFNIRKAGHTGALDPLATGMLPICLGDATKFSQYLINSDKRYRVIARLGESTDTFDADGSIINTRFVAVTQNKLKIALESFRGSILQVPPMFSALKYRGRPLYEYARKQIKVERAARPIFIYELLLIRWKSNELELEIHCSKGTYIRSIIDDLGEKLGCGAHVTMLRRLQVSHYTTEKMVTLKKLQELVHNANIHSISSLIVLNPFLLPMDSLVANCPEIHLQKSLPKDSRANSSRDGSVNC
ncbi:tRNA pseudouridine(55) synthase TruB [Candidatus Pantoea carbekii]|uniref:tRNA pseudouridine synthase B n=1 Tax=Candidatus Pantoea carbekii TaxID=1235990 RepID=U3U7H0_9GAMM|nr:tRNA pseudouridine synthase B [Candidatus Pantoea carbekii]BAO00347.1 TruB protein [Candidatus Pantoea carbekii]